jgi:predicted AlkP superfamily pyrophosphatase or phosphodiesterase
MNFPFRTLLLAGLALGAAACTHQEVAPKRPAAAQSVAMTVSKDSAAAPLLLISIDGYRADYIDRHLSPSLSQLAATGVRAQAMQPSFPSLTFPNHYTLVTGLRPDHQGIVNNTMSDPALGKFSLGDRKAVGDGRWWNEGTPIWEVADAQGLKTATMFWPGSEADIHGQRPDYWQPYNGDVTPEQRVDQVLAWLDLPAAQRPRFFTLYFDAVDHAGHSFGPDSSEVNQAIGETDAAMTRLVDGLKARGLYDKINIIVVSDHGMASTPASNNVLVDKLIDMDQVQSVSLGVVAGFNPKPGFNFDEIEHTLTRPQPHMQCWDKTDMPARFDYGHNPRVPQLVCLANIGWRITSSTALAQRKGKVSIGEHGYDNADPQMRALFVAHGPSFRSGALVPQFPNVDVYPLMTHLLKLTPNANDGDYDQVKEMLKPELR